MMNSLTNTLYGRLTALRTSDVMNRDVVMVDSSLAMEEAARLMSNRGVTSAPVVDEKGHCVGMLSAADFLLREVSPEQASAGRARDETDYVVMQRRGEPLHIERMEGRNVRGHMSAGVQSIRAETPLLEAARIMCASHLHRLPVLDDDGRPIGVVSSLDLVSAMMNAVDEQQQLATRSGQ
jgi:CBS-domain-containing membrane protein